MSVLELLGNVLTELEKVQAKLDRLLVQGSDWSTKEHMEVDLKNAKKIVTMSDEVFRKDIATKEEVDMDFSQVTVMNQSEKALLVVKNGYQQWLARQFIKNPLELGYQNGNMYDIKLKEESNSGKPISWVTKKWKPFEVFKN